MEHQTENPVNLVEGLTNEILRVTEIVTEYRAIPKGAGHLAASFMEDAIQRARKAQSSGDVIQMISAFQELKDFEL